MMKLALRIIVTFMCLYVFIAKTYAVVYHLQRHMCDDPILILDLVVLFACVLLVLFLWGKNIKIKYALVWNLILLVDALLQIFCGLLEFLTKSPLVDQTMVIWVFDIPNLLSVFLLVITMIKMRSFCRWPWSYVADEEDNGSRRR